MHSRCKPLEEIFIGTRARSYVGNVNHKRRLREILIDSRGQLNRFFFFSPARDVTAVKKKKEKKERISRAFFSAGKRDSREMLISIPISWNSIRKRKKKKIEMKRGTFEFSRNGRVLQQEEIVLVSFTRYETNLLSTDSF